MFHVLCFNLATGINQPRDHSAAYHRDKKRRKIKSGSSNRVAETPPYDVVAHISHQPMPEPWIQELGLGKHEEQILLRGEWLNDTLIDVGQMLHA